MKHLMRISIILSTLVGCGVTHATIPFYSIRSQAIAPARNLAGWTNYLYDPYADDYHGIFGAAFEYTRTFRHRNIERCLFGLDLIGPHDCQYIKISGSQVANRDNRAWLADYFCLPTDFESEISFSPRIDNFITDLEAHINFDKYTCAKGLYIEFHAPIVHTRWKLGKKENVVKSGVNNHNAGYFTPVSIRRTNLLDDFCAYIEGKETPLLGGDDLIQTSTFLPLCCSKFIDSCTKTKLAAVELIVGYNAILEDNYHVGFNLRALAPTGNRPHATYLFEPIVGNGHHWEFGGGVSAHYQICQSDDEETHFGIYFEADATHLFKTRQKRSFDLTNGSNSRYMLAQKLGTPVGEFLWSNPLDALSGGLNGSTQPSAEFKGIFQPVANLTCCDVKVDISVQAEIVALFNYTSGNFSWDMGYQFWGRSCDNIDLDCECCPLSFAPNTWALKGDAYVYGFSESNYPFAMPYSIESGDPITLSGTQSKATLHNGTNAAFTSNNENLRNFGVDNAEFGRIVESNANNGLNIIYTSGGGADAQTKTSNEPIFLSKSDIDVESARTKGISHTLFTHVSYTWRTIQNWTPYLGVGAKAEIAQHNDNECKPCTGCGNCTPSEWGIWVKAGVTFH